MPIGWKNQKELIHCIERDLALKTLKREKP